MRKTNIIDQFLFQIFNTMSKILILTIVVIAGLGVVTRTAASPQHRHQGPILQNFFCLTDEGIMCSMMHS